MNLLALQDVGPKAGAPGVAHESTSSSAPPAQQPAGSSQWVMLMPIVIVMGVMLLMNRNQKKKDAETRSKLKKGDKVVSQSGLIGELVDMDDRLAKVKIAPGTNVQMLIGSVSPFEVAAPVAKATDDKQLKDLKDAKALADKK